MKIINSSGIYIQRIDVYYMESVNVEIPDTLKERVLNGKRDYSIDEMYDFVRIVNERDIEFLKNDKYLFNYDDIKNMSLIDLKKLYKKYKDDAVRFSEIYHILTPEEKVYNKDILDEIKRLKYKFIMLSDIICFMSGNWEYILPKEVEYPQGMKIPKSIFLKRVINLVKDKYYH